MSNDLEDRVRILECKVRQLLLVGNSDSYKAASSQTSIPVGGYFTRKNVLAIARDTYGLSIKLATSILDMHTEIRRQITKSRNDNNRREYNITLFNLEDYHRQIRLALRKSMKVGSSIKMRVFPTLNFAKYRTPALRDDAIES